LPSAHKVYTFGRPFRQKKNPTPAATSAGLDDRPEIAFADLSDNCDAGRRAPQVAFETLIRRGADDLAILDDFLRIEKGLLAKLDGDRRSSEFVRMDYGEGDRGLSAPSRSRSFRWKWGIDLQSEARALSHPRKARQEARHRDELPQGKSGVSTCG